MIPQFILIPHENKEILINLATITRIEVIYTIENEKTIIPASLHGGRLEPSSVRRYRVFAGDGLFEFQADPNNKAFAAIEQIYKNAIRA